MQVVYSHDQISIVSLVATQLFYSSILSMGTVLLCICFQFAVKETDLPEVPSLGCMLLTSWELGSSVYRAIPVDLT